MKSLLLLTHSSEIEHQLDDLLGQHASVVLQPPPADPGREKFDALFATWLPMTDGVFLDAASLGEAARWAIESLAAVPVRPSQAIVVRATAMQRQVYPLPAGWLIVNDTDSLELLQQTLGRFFELRDTQSKLKRLEEFRSRARPASRPVPAPTEPPAPAATHRYRQALKALSFTLGQQRDRASLLKEFGRLLRELVGVSRLALFIREDDHFTLAAGTGIKPEVAQHFRLRADTGIGAWLSREGTILQRSMLADAWALDDAEALTREFDLLGAEVAVPMADAGVSGLAGVVTLGGRITGEALSGDDLELVYYLLEHLAGALRYRELLERVESQQRFTSEVLANVQTGVVIVGDDHRLVSVNRRAVELLGLPAQEFAGQPLNALPGVVGDALYESSGRRELSLPGGLLLSVNISRVGAVTVALVDDLTETRRAESAARLEEEKEFFTRVAYRLSHELKNSLVSIKIFGQLLPERHQEKDFREQFSNVVVNEVNRVDVLVNNLTFFSQPLALVYEELALSELLETCLRNVTVEFGRKKLAHLVAMGEKPPEDAGSVPVVIVKRNFSHKTTRFEADRIRLIQALEQVLRNAAQAMPAGGRLILSTVDAPASAEVPEGGAVRIEVGDTGEGISLDTLPRVTEPFFTTRNVGVGLGLTIVKKIVERHSGRLVIESMLGRGTTVTLAMPAMHQPHPEEQLMMKIAKGSSSEELFRERKELRETAVKAGVAQQGGSSHGTSKNFGGG